MKKLFKAEYRIAYDEFLGYEVQVRYWWLPIWIQPEINTHRTIEKAEAWALAHAKGCAKYLGKL